MWIAPESGLGIDASSQITDGDATGGPRVDPDAWGDSLVSRIVPDSGTINATGTKWAGGGRGGGGVGGGPGERPRRRHRRQRRRAAGGGSGRRDLAAERHRLLAHERA